MDEDVSQEPNARKVRIGLVLISVVFVVGIGLIFVIDDPLGRLIMGAVVLFVVIRTALLVRAIKRAQRAGG
ncbi:MAG: hypothetical protein LC749_18395 [Actinobacteria bacterium]|nr:hypothetical protein [Actinomycetota bacterium]